MAKWSDNFDDNYLDPAKWEKIELTQGTVAERNMRVELTCPSGTPSSCAGIVTRDRYDLKRGKVTVYLASLKCWDIFLQISNEKVTATYPDRVSNHYHILLWRYGKETFVWRRVRGVLKELYRAPWTAPSNVFRIEIEAGYIRLYEGDKCVYNEPYQLPSYECYIYVYTFGGEGFTGTDWADDFVCEYSETEEEKSEAEMLIRREEAKQFLVAGGWGLIVALAIVAIVVWWVAVRA